MGKDTFNIGFSRMSSFSKSNTASTICF